MKTPKTKTKDLTPKAPARVKGGGRLVNDNITLVRGAKPTGGKKDLSPKSSSGVKGGGKRLNDNITLVRASSR
jgi:hypothetical protein